MGIKADIQKLELTALVELFELDTSSIPGGGLLYFHAGVNEVGHTVVWQGIEYTRYPVEADGFEWTGQGALPRPRMRVANVTGVMGALLKSLNDLLGAKITRHRTLLKYLDGVNFANGYNPYADPNAHFSDEVYTVDRKAAENKVFIEFELSAAFDITGTKLPRRQVIRNVCWWTYRSSECTYAGPPVADANDVPTSDPTKDVCGKRVRSCQLRFGNRAVLPYGGAPGTGITR